MKKILILSTVHHLEDNRIFYKEAYSLKKISSDITFAVQHPNKQLKEFNGIKIFPLKVQKSIIKRIFTTHFDVYKLIKKEKFSFIHFHDPELIILMYLIKKKFKVKVIFDIHENIAESIKDKHWIPKYLAKLITIIYSQIENRLTKKFDCLIVAETSYKKTYGEDVVEILNYPLLIEENYDLQKNFSGSINFVYAGDIMERKGIWIMLKLYENAYKKIESSHFNLLGRFVPAELEQEVRAYINEKNLDANITIHGRVSIKVVNTILEKSHIGFSILEPVANYIGSLPTKIFDYMNNKVVVISSDFSLYKRYVDECNTGISINFYNYEQYFNSVLKIIQSPEKMRQMAENGYSQVKNYWNWKDQEAKLLRIYSDNN